MSKDAPLKSAYELAMERLRKNDREAGIEESRPLTAAQKKKIADLRVKAKAELAELEILRHKRLEDAAADPVKLQEVEEHEAIDRKRVESRLEASVKKVREQRS